MADENNKPQGSPTRKTIAPQPHSNERKTPTESTLELISKRIKEQNEHSNGDTKELVDTIKKSLSTIIVDLKSENKLVRRQNLFALKETRAQIMTLEEGIFTDKQVVIDGIDAVVQAAEHNTTSLTALTEKLDKSLFKNLMKSLPTAKGFVNAFIKNSNPLLQVAVNIVDDVANLVSASKKEAEDARKKDIDAKAKQLDSIKAVAAASKKTADQTTELVKTEVKERKKYTRKGEGPVVSRLEKLKGSTDIQTRLLQAIYEDLSGKKFDVEELIRQDSEMLKEFVEGVKEGIAQEGKAKGADPELVRGLIEGVHEEAAPLVKAMQDQEAELKKVNTNLKAQTELQKKADADRRDNEFKEKTPEPVQSGQTKAGSMFKKEKSFLENMIGGIAGAVGSLFASVGKMFTGAFGTVGRSVLGIVTKAGAFLKLIGKASGIFTIILAVFDFLSGFNNADKILGKAEGALTLWDKVSAGLGMVVEGFASLFDFLGGFVGINRGWSKGIAEKVGKFLSNIGETVTALFNDVWSSIQTGWDTVRSTISEIIDPKFWKQKAENALSFVSDISDVILDFVKGIIRFHLKFLPSSVVPDWLEKALEPTSKGAKAPTGGSSLEPAPTGAKETLSPSGEAQPPTEKRGFAEQYEKADQEIEMLRKKSEAAKVPSMNQQSNNTVNANTTNYYPSPLKTRNDDDSIRGVNFNWG